MSNSKEGNGVEILAMASYLPTNRRSNADLVKLFPHVSESQILKSTGIKHRHISAPDEIGSDVCYRAGEMLFQKHLEIDRSNIDYLLFCTEGLDYKAPTTSAILHQRLQLSHSCGSADLPAGCTGFVNGLMIAQSMIKAGNAESILLLAGDVPSKVIHPEDIELLSLFGDAGTATLLKRTDSGVANMGPFVYGTDGTGYEYLLVERSGSRNPVDRQWFNDHQDLGFLPWGRLRMNGPAIFSFSLKRVPPMIEELCKKSNTTIDDIDHFIFHQANGFLLKVLRDKLGIPQEKFHMHLVEVGNTVSASIPLTLQHVWQNGKCKNGDTIMLVSFGIGLSWAAGIIVL